MDKSGYTLLPNRADNKCFGCGPANPQGLQMQFYTNGQTVASWITVPPHLCGWSNLAHGGILFTALDEIMGRTMIYLLKRFILTKSIDDRVSQARPARPGVQGGGKDPGGPQRTGGRGRGHHHQ